MCCVKLLALYCSVQYYLFRPGLLLCAHNPKVEVALAIIKEVKLLRSIVSNHGA